MYEYFPFLVFIGALVAKLQCEDKFSLSLFLKPVISST